MSLSADRAELGRRVVRGGLAVGSKEGGGLFRWLGGAEKPAAKVEILPAAAVGEKAEASDSHETLGQDMEQEPARELSGLQGHAAVDCPPSMVLPTKGDATFFQAEESAIGDGDAMGVAGQVFEDLLGTPEGRFGVNSPFGATQLGPQSSPGDWAGGGLKVSVLPLRKKPWPFSGICRW